MADLRPFSQDFIGFLGKSFTTLNPGQPFLMNWHLDLMAEYLEAVRIGQINRLIINMPPRALKSITVSVAWPAWLMGKCPQIKIMAASYVQTLAVKHSLDCRAVMESAWYKQLFTNTRLSPVQNEKHKFLTTEFGMRMATSIWGSATGEGGDILIADDPMNPLQAQSEATRRMVKDWFDHTFSTRLDDKKRGSIVVVMQRLHEDDLCGHLLNREGWELLRLPALNEQRQEWYIGGKHFVLEAERPLHNEREDRRLIEHAKRQLGSQQFAAQYQQMPLPAEGGMIKLEWFRRF